MPAAPRATTRHLGSPVSFTLQRQSSSPEIHQSSSLLSRHSPSGSFQPLRRPIDPELKVRRVSPSPPPRAVIGNPKRRTQQQSLPRAPEALPEVPKMVACSCKSCDFQTGATLHVDRDCSWCGGSGELRLGAAVRGSIRESDATLICDCEDIGKLLALSGPFDKGSELIWFAQRVQLNDPTLVELDLSRKMLPPGDEEPRILRKLFDGLRTNTHLQTLRLNNVGLYADNDVAALAAALQQNTRLKELDVESNFLEPPQLIMLVRALAIEEHSSTVLQTLRCCNQFSQEEAGDSVFAAMQSTLNTNKRLRYLGIHVTNMCYRTAIDRKLIDNCETGRKAAMHAKALELAQAKRDQNARRSSKWIRDSGSSSPTGTRGSGTSGSM